MVGSDACLILHTDVTLTDVGFTAKVTERFTAEWLFNQLKTRSVKIEIDLRNTPLTYVGYFDVIGYNESERAFSVVVTGTLIPLTFVIASLFDLDNTNEWTLTID